MSLIHVARGDEVLGQFTEAEVREGLADGSMLATDTAWRVGRRGWTPLAEWPEFGDAPPPASSARSVSPPVAVPAWVGQALERARAWFAEPGEPPTGGAASPEWEDDAKGDPVRRLVLTLRDILLRHAATFHGFSPNGSLLKPAGFLVAVGLGVVTPVRIVMRLRGSAVPFFSGADPTPELWTRVVGCVWDVAPCLVGLLMTAVVQSLLLALGLSLFSRPGVPVQLLFRLSAYHAGAAYTVAAGLALLIAPFSLGLAGIGYLALVLAWGAGLARALVYATEATPKEAGGAVFLALVFCGAPGLL